MPTLHELAERERHAAHVAECSICRRSSSDTLRGVCPPEPVRPWNEAAREDWSAFELTDAQLVADIAREFD